MAAVANEVERSNAVVIAGDSFAIDDAGTRTQACQCLNDQRKAVSEVIARTTIEPHSLVVLAGNDAETVMFDFMQPLAARGQLVGLGWETRGAMNPAGKVRWNMRKQIELGRDDCNSAELAASATLVSWFSSSAPNALPVLGSYPARDRAAGG